MALYAIGDLHLSFGTDKPMDVFGGAWKGYVEKLRTGLSVIGSEDTTDMRMQRMSRILRMRFFINSSFQMGTNVRSGL